MSLSVLLVLICSAPSAPTSATTATKAEVEAARAVVAKSLPFVVERGTWWIEKKKCVSCHRVGMMVWALNDAAERGFEVDEKKLQGWIDWSYDSGFDETEYKTKGAEAAKNADGLSQLLLGTTSERLDVARRKKLAELIAAVRKPDGSWTPEGQLPGQKRPLPETTAVSTMWQTLALSSEDKAVYRPASAKVTEPAAAEKVAEPKSTEWWVLRSVLSRNRGDQREADRAQAELLKLQHDDGGWGWLTDGESDAIATGMALYALADADFDSKQPSIRRAWKFLAQSQKPDGGWDVKGTKKAKMNGVEETSRYWGATWAVIGIVRTLPE